MPRHGNFPRWIALAALLWLAASGSISKASDEVHAPPAPGELKTAVLAWLGQQGLTNTPVMDVVSPLWEFPESPSADQLFDALMRTLYLADDDVRRLVDNCSAWRYSPALLQLQVPDRRDQPLVTNNVRYFLARHLTLLSAYNEALDVFEGIDLRSVVDPAGLLFHRAVCQHHLLLKDEGLASLHLLLDQTERVPARYRALGELMQRDLEELKPKTLGEVARQMKDVERRLSLGKTDQGVRDVEDRILATLDELIKKMEDEQNQSSSPAGGMSSGAPNKPADESYVGGIKGPGETDKKDIGHKDRWGDLPDKEREAAKNMLDRQFPAHYRQAVEEYLKKLAERPAPQR